MKCHRLELEPLSLATESAARGRRETAGLCPGELALYLVVIFLVVAVAGPDRVAALAGAVGGGVAEVVQGTFEAGGFLRPSW